MKNKNNIKRVTENKNMQSIQEKKIQINENNIIRNSRKNYNTNNHVHFYSNSSKKNKDVLNNDRIIENKIKNEAKEELDHPKPLITENDEDLDNLKSQFDQKEQKEINVTPPTSENAIIQKNENLEKTKDSSEGQESNYEYKIIKSEKNKMVCSDLKNYNNKGNNLKMNKNNKTEGVNSINKGKNILISVNKMSEYKNKNNKNNPFIRNNFNMKNNNKTFDRKINNNFVVDKYLNIEKENQNSNINSNKKENISYVSNQANSLIKNKNNKNSKKILSSKESLKTKIKTIEVKPIKRLIYQECEKNYSSEKKINNFQNVSKNNIRYYRHSINDTKIIYKKLDLTMNNSRSRNLSIDKIKLLNKKDDKDKDKDALDKDNTNKIQTSKKESNETKPQQQNRLLNQKAINLNQIKNFNNTKTTYVVFSKNNKISQIPKVNFTPIFKQNYTKISNQKKNLVKPKMTLSNQLSFSNAKHLFAQKQKKITLNKSQKKIYFFNKPEYENDFRNSNKTTIYENNKEIFDDLKDKKPIQVIKNYPKNKQNIFPSYGSNYDYQYYYGNNFFDNNCVPIEYNAPYTGKYIY